MNRSVFFSSIRSSLFGGSMSQGQVDGTNRILDYRDAKWPAMPDDELAYLLATVKHETAHTMQPVKEMGGEAYLKSKKYYPFYGRGLVQITWRENYAKFGYADNPDAVLKWPASLDIIYRGMIFGMFTGKKLSDYILHGRCDFVNARRIINGTDKAQQIAAIAEGFRKAFVAAQKAPVEEPDVGPVDPMPEPVPPPPPMPPSPEPDIVDPTPDPTPYPEPSDNLREDLLSLLYNDTEVSNAIIAIIAGKLRDQ